MIFKAVRERPPYPDHGVTTQRDWAVIAPRQIRLADLTTTRATLDLRSLLDDDSTFYGDLFAHVVSFKGDLYLETGLHRALRAALQGAPRSTPASSSSCCTVAARPTVSEPL